MPLAPLINGQPNEREEALTDHHGALSAPNPGSCCVYRPGPGIMFAGGIIP
jgi:hypothetical protein